MFISKGVIRSLSLTTKFPSETCGELPGALQGCPPLEGVASNKVQPAQAQPSPRLAKNSPLDCFCPALQGRSLRGRLPLLYDKIPPVKKFTQKIKCMLH